MVADAKKGMMGCITADMPYSCTFPHKQVLFATVRDRVLG